MRANQQQTGEFALRSGGGLQSDDIHTSDFENTLLEEPHNFQAALRQFLRL